MANCLEITLWYPEDKFNALSTALEPAGSSVEEELGRVLTELYERLVPSEQRVEIAEKLAREEQHEAEERVRHEAETYRVSLWYSPAGPASTISSRGPGTSLPWPPLSGRRCESRRHPQAAIFVPGWERRNAFLLKTLPSCRWRAFAMILM